MNCHYCASKIEYWNKYCPQCGGPISEIQRKQTYGGTHEYMPDIPHNAIAHSEKRGVLSPHIKTHGIGESLSHILIVIGIPFGIGSVLFYFFVSPSAAIGCAAFGLFIALILTISALDATPNEGTGDL